MTLRSPDPTDKPDVTLNFLERQEDVLRSAQWGAAGASHPGRTRVRSLPAGRVGSGPGVQTEAALIDFIHQTVATTYHTAGTCKMGSDSEAVVDHELRVRGLEGLRVIDASIMPTVVAAPTNAASIMIGGKGRGAHPLYINC